MKKEAVRHTGAFPDVYLTDRRTLVVSIRTAKQDLRSVCIYYFSRTTPEIRQKRDMQLYLRDSLFDYFRVEINFRQVARYQKYFFEFKTKNSGTVYYQATGFGEHEPEEGFFEFLYANETEVVKVPDWTKGQVFYQIFPERFANGDRRNNPENCEAWGSKPSRDNFMGGDLKGIIEHIPYLKELGIQCVYLNPIFKADFNHKYATTDYFEIDPEFGTKEDLRDLIEKLHQSGIRILLDGVFNHCGIHFEKFQDVIKNQENSKYKDWFYIDHFPLEISHHGYECVGAYKFMPKLNTGNPDVRNFILQVMDYWIREYHIDGWRLDVADEVDESVWRSARLILKSKYPDIMLLGETWGTGARLMDGSQMDGIMNYVFRDAVVDFVAKGTIKANEFDSRIQKMLSDYPWPMNEAMFLPLDTHDTERFLTLCQDDTRKLKLAVSIQMCFVGSPNVYYGDEIGMTGENDPDCRKCMIWDADKQDQDLLEFYKLLIAFRKGSSAVRSGNFLANYCQGMVYGFVRTDVTESVYVLVNAGEKKADCKLPVLKEGKYKNILNNEEHLTVAETPDGAMNSDAVSYKGHISLELQPYEVIILQEMKA